MFPASDWGQQIQDLYALLFWVALVVFIGVEGFLLFRIIRFLAAMRTRSRLRSTATRSSKSPGRSFPHNPAGYRGPEHADDLCVRRPAARDREPAEGSGRSDTSGGGNSSTLSSIFAPLTGSPPTGRRTATFDLESANVIHSFWVPKMGGKSTPCPAAKTICGSPGQRPVISSANALSVRDGACGHSSSSSCDSPPRISTRGFRPSAAMLWHQKLLVRLNRGLLYFTSAHVLPATDSRDNAPGRSWSRAQPMWGAAETDRGQGMMDNNPEESETLDPD